MTTRPRGFPSFIGTIAQRIKGADDTIAKLNDRVRALTIANAAQARQIGRLRDQIKTSKGDE